MFFALQAKNKIKIKKRENFEGEKTLMLLGFTSSIDILRVIFCPTIKFFINSARILQPRLYRLQDLKLLDSDPTKNLHENTY